MRTHQVKWMLVCVWLAAVALANANENPSGLGGEAVNQNSKVKVIDNSRVLTREEVDKLGEARNSIPVVVPLLKKPPRIVDPKAFNPQIAVDPVPEPPAAPASAPEVKTEDESDDIKLPPMPLIMPSFLHGLIPSGFDSPVVESPSDSDKPKDEGIVRVILLKSHRLGEPSEPSNQAGENPGKPSSFMIFRILPRPIGNLFGLDSEDESAASESSQKLLGGGDDDVDKKREPQHLLGGGDDDVDKKRVVHLLGGGGENDPDRLRLDRLEIDTENNKGVFTGGNEDVFNNNMNQHKIFVVSMFDRLRSVFDNMRQSIEQQVRGVGGDDSQSSELYNNNGPLPFISIRTDDGQSALIPNDIGYAEKHQHEQSLNKCMMLQFMRLKASMYYRTMLHLLFFTGVLLFIFSLLFLTVRTCRRRALGRRHRHLLHRNIHHTNMSVASVEAAGGKSKLAAYKAWQGMDQSSLIEPSDKVVLIQAPPAYDQVFIHDKNSTLASSAAPRQLSSFTCNDECETKSLPPDYDEKTSAVHQ